MNHCPIAFALDIFGDHWSLLILRDIIFMGKKRYKELMASGEGIATNVLAERLLRLETHGILSKTVDPSSKRQFIYEPTKKGLDLLPLLLELIRWGAAYDADTAAPKEFIRRLEKDPEGVKQEFLSKFKINTAPKQKKRK